MAHAAKRLKVDEKAAWTEARLKLLEEEKALSKQVAELAAKRQALPRLEISDYEFQGPDGAVKLSDVFGPHDQIIVQHMMFADGWEKPCPLCCAWIDMISGTLPHIKSRVGYVVVGKAPFAQIQTAAKSKSWNMDDITFLSAETNTFNEDLGVSFTQEQVDQKTTVYNYNRTFAYGTQAPGMSVFFKDKDTGKVYLTYSTFAAGLGSVSLMHDLLDIVPSGRDETGEGKRNMWWVKHKEDY